MSYCRHMTRANWREYCVTCERWTRFGCYLDRNPHVPYTGSPEAYKCRGRTIVRHLL